MTAKTDTQRAAEFRERRAQAGITRFEVYAHPEDHKAIKALADKLNKPRLTKPKPKQP